MNMGNSRNEKVSMACAFVYYLQIDHHIFFFYLHVYVYCIPFSSKFDAANSMHQPDLINASSHCRRFARPKLNMKTERKDKRAKNKP